LDLFSDEEATKIKDKLDLYNTLSFKHNVQTVEELMALQRSISDQLEQISNVENELIVLEKEIGELKKEVTNRAAILRKKRLSKTKDLEQEVKKRLTNLAMPSAELAIELKEKLKPSLSGIDEIEFNFKTNLGGAFSPIKKVASGGELSRLMLAILSILSEKKNLPTLIFDEIDTGVSGEVATKMAQEFDSIGKKIQVITITHLPQVAAKAQTHLHVKKFVEDNKTKTYIAVLKGDERIDVLAGMMSGEAITKAAKENAADLLANN